VVFIDPTTNAVVQNVPIGSDPDFLALSADGSTLWVGIDGAQAMRKLTLSSPPMVGPFVRTSPNGPFGPLVVLPGTATSVVASVPSAAESLLGSIAVFDDGVQRTATVNVPSSVLAAGPPNVVFGMQTLGVTVLQVSAGGIVQQPYGGLEGAGEILYANGRLYGNTGVVMDVTNLARPTRRGQFPYEGPIALRDAQHLLMLTADNSFPPLNGPTLRVLAMDDSFGQTGAVTLPLAVAPMSTTLLGDLVYAGDDAAAFIVAPLDGPTSITIVHDPLVATEVGGGTGGARCSRA
jgi:hypothetical protein